ncbi:uncharacterized protein LOC125278217 isoform X2 [Megalobrama amblycephala]|uniref:uncharacterized protein LOC125278217 isoform X2 n=1 Tax=Megalobrama amblycephala TaxID=75352 RepID=UPI002013E3DC|nr:uncharacterized protein LOC125278217 isoform X2 [Megalobrama amblycephala]
MPSWHSPLPHTVNSWTVFYKRQVTFRFVQTLIQALTLINWLWPHVLSALANSQRADMEGGKFVMEQRKKDKKGDSRDEKGSRCGAEGVRCLYVICSGGCAYTHPRGMLSALMEGARAPGLRWWGEWVTAYAHLEALQVNRAWLPERGHIRGLKNEQTRL